MKVVVLADITWGRGLVHGVYGTRDLAVRASGVAPAAWRVEDRGVLRADTNPGDTRPDAQQHLHAEEHELQGPEPGPPGSRVWVRVDHLHDYVWVSGVFTTAAAARRDSDLRHPDGWRQRGPAQWDADVTTISCPTHAYATRIVVEECAYVRS